MSSGMEATQLQAQVALLNQQSLNLGPKARIEEATEQFEAVFLRKFLGDSLKPLLHSTPGSGAPGAGVYQYMVTDALANQLSESGEFGFASLLQMQLTGGRGDVEVVPDGKANSIEKGTGEL